MSVTVTAADRNLLILVSMVSVLTGVVRSPFTAAIQVLEMTCQCSAILQLLISGQLAQDVASLPAPHSLYEPLSAGFIRETGEVDRAAQLLPPDGVGHNATQ